MKLFNIFVVALFVFLPTSSVVYAGQKYDTSRLITTSSISTATTEAEQLLRLVKSEAQTVVNRMVLIDKEEGYEGEHKITVQIIVSIQRAPKTADSDEDK